jgi:hypothetical protein
MTIISKGSFATFNGIGLPSPLDPRGPKGR